MNGTMLQDLTASQKSPPTSFVEERGSRDGPQARPGTSSEVELRRDLKERHINMIAFSACVGIGLFLRTGKVVFLAGPGLATLAYLFAGSVMWSVMGSLGEMTALYPIQGSIFVLPARFLDSGVGYAAGWMSWFSWVVIIAAEVLAVAQLWNFRFTEDYLLHTANFPGPHPSLGWQVGQDINPAIWVLIFLLLILAVNCLPVLWYGRLEYIFGCMKMIFIVGLIMFNLILSATQPVKHESHGWTYDSPYGFQSENFTLHGSTILGNSTDEVVITGGGAHFLGMWTAITTVIFSMIDFETISITAAECRNLENTNAIKMGTRKISLRIIILYTLGTLVVSFNVPYTDPNLRDLAVTSITPGQNSIFILAAVRNHIRVWPHIFNGFFIFSATTSGMNSLYLSSRILHALASIPEVWPEYSIAQSVKKRLERTSKGVPHGAVFVSWIFGLLAFLAAGKAPARQLGRIATNAVVSMLIVYAIICLTYLKFYDDINAAAAGQANDVPAEDREAFNRANKQMFPFKSRGQWLKAAYGMIGCSLLALFNGWQSFVPPFTPSDFVASYISFLIFVLLVVAYHIKIDGSWKPWAWTRNTSPTRLMNPPPISKASPPNIEGGSRGDQKPSYSTDTVVGTWSRTKEAAKWMWSWIK